MLYMVAFVYIVSGVGGTLEIDVTLSLMRAMWLHKTAANGDVSQEARCGKLLYYERCGHIRDAHARKEELSFAGRAYIESLVDRRNPDREDLSAHWFPVEPPDFGPSPLAVAEIPAGKITVH
jgi:predicted GIY-YIG superfamily endonuclease